MPSQWKTQKPESNGYHCCKPCWNNGPNSDEMYALIVLLLERLSDVLHDFGEHQDTFFVAWHRDSSGLRQGKIWSHHGALECRLLRDPAHWQIPKTTIHSTILYIIQAKIIK